MSRRRSAAERSGSSSVTRWKSEQTNECDRGVGIRQLQAGENGLVKKIICTSHWCQSCIDTFFHFDLLL